MKIILDIDSTCVASATFCEDDAPTSTRLVTARSPRGSILPLGERAATMLTQVCVGVSLFLEASDNATKQAAA
jgi:hypothetical protein